MAGNDDLIRPLNDCLLGDLSIEELEARLEMQILHPPESQLCYDCNEHVCDTFNGPFEGGCDERSCGSYSADPMEQ